MSLDKRCPRCGRRLNAAQVDCDYRQCCRDFTIALLEAWEEGAAMKGPGAPAFDTITGDHLAALSVAISAIADSDSHYDLKCKANALLTQLYHAIQDAKRPHHLSNSNPYRKVFK